MEENKKVQEERKVDPREERVRAITRLYYSNPKVIEAMTKFAQDREVVPRYFEGFGKRPDKIQYPSDIMGMVNRGATSFHASEEIWNDPLMINSEMTPEEFGNLRKSWDLLIDIDSKYLDYSKIAAILVIEQLEKHGIKNYGVKFSGSKGFHIILSGNAFPKEYNGKKMNEMFPEWPRAICQYITSEIKSNYNKTIREKLDFDSLKLRTNLEKKDVVKILCPNCGKEIEKVKVVRLECPDCSATIERVNPRITKKGVRCINERCMSVMNISSEEEAYYCESCKISNIGKGEDDKTKNIVYSSFARESEKKFSDEFEEEISEDILGGLDLVLVAPRHLFRMPYSLHEKTALASVVLSKEEIENFLPGDANPLKIKIREFMPENKEGEATLLLRYALDWKGERDGKDERELTKKYANYEKIDIQGVTEDMFPAPIKKLLKGLKDGKKRGLFILITFLRTINFSPEYINGKIREWNKKNETPLKEGYIKSQLDWHLRQRKTILPPNYDNPSFYKDLGLLDGVPNAKNPVSEIIRKIKNRNN